ncbi:hypothetical protein B0H14DRAFT_1294345 [Mycena olivaceomarginata]|nr:hypothetical protein B0H14DRAFT_1294345 [Mycena olivaceomarginata]
MSLVPFTLRVSSQALRQPASCACTPGLSGHLVPCSPASRLQFSRVEVRRVLSSPQHGVWQSRAETLPQTQWTPARILPNHRPRVVAAWNIPEKPVLLRESYLRHRFRRLHTTPRLPRPKQVEDGYCSRSSSPSPTTARSKFCEWEGVGGQFVPLPLQQCLHRAVPPEA